MAFQRTNPPSQAARPPRIPVLPIRATSPSSGSGCPQEPVAPEAVDQDSLAGFGCTYFKLLVTDYLSIVNPMPVAIRTQLDALVNKIGAPTQWDDVYTLERGLITVMPEPTLRARLPFLRSEFEEAATADEYQEYLRTPPPDAKNAPVDQVRADAVVLIDQLQWRSITTPYFEKLRSGLLFQLAIRTLIYLVVAFFILLIIAFKDPTPTLYCDHLLAAFLFGVLGGCLSTMQRIQALPSSAGALTNLKSLQGNQSSLLVSPIIGGIAAGLLYYLCAGQLLPNTLFPSLTDLTHQPGNSVRAFVGGGAADYQNAAKLVVWSFVAGFSERFIPDTVSRLTAKLSS